ncbi:MAG: hypothetical protein ACRDIB_06910, partial [Ardenticatenaceae bacterium]
MSTSGWGELLGELEAKALSLGAIWRRRRGRGWRAWLRARNPLVSMREWLPPGAEDRERLGYPVRARPSRIEIIEEYHSRIKFERHARYQKKPVRIVGEIQISLPCDRMGREAIMDAFQHTAHLAGDIPIRYGWLGLSHVQKTNLPERLREVRPWGEPAYCAFPLVSPLLPAGTERLEDQIEAGAFGWEQLYYCPEPP